MCAEVLVVDRDVEGRSLLQAHFSNNGFHAFATASAASARTIVAECRPDLVLLDGSLGTEPGTSLVRWLSTEHPEVGIILVSQSADLVDRVVALELGADDFIAKPYDKQEILARARSVLRRIETVHSLPVRPGRFKPSAYSGSWIQFGVCKVDLAKFEMRDATGEQLEIGHIDFRILAAFAANPKKPLTRDQLLEHAHGPDAEAFDRSIDLRVMRLRRLVEPDPERPIVIKTMRKVGYVYVPLECASYRRT